MRKEITMDYGLYMHELNDAKTSGWFKARDQMARIIGVRKDLERGIYLLDEHVPHSHSEMILKLFDEFWEVE